MYICVSVIMSSVVMVVLHENCEYGSDVYVDIELDAASLCLMTTLATMVAVYGPHCTFHLRLRHWSLLLLQRSRVLAAILPYKSVGLFVDRARPPAMLLLWRCPASLWGSVVR